MDEVRILDLVLKGVWYDMIDSGIKKEEYRIQKQYWKTRLDGKIYDVVKFHRGYTNEITMMFEIESITIGLGNPDWGAPEDSEVYIIKLGERL